MVLPTDPLERVRPGMQVVDTGGRRIGQVVRAQVAAPPVSHPPDSDILDDMNQLVPAPPDMSEAGAEMDIIGPSPVGHDPVGLPDLPEPLRAHLADVGFLEIEAPGLGRVDRYIAADQIQEVGQDSVVVHTQPPS